jgi:hypothetical protein
MDNVKIKSRFFAASLYLSNNEFVALSPMDFLVRVFPILAIRLFSFPKHPHDTVDPSLRFERRTSLILPQLQRHIKKYSVGGTLLENEIIVSIPYVFPMYLFIVFWRIIMSNHILVDRSITLTAGI